MAKKFKMAIPFQPTPLYEERSRLTEEFLILTYEYRFLRRQMALVNGIKEYAKSEDEKK